MRRLGTAPTDRQNPAMNWEANDLVHDGSRGRVNWYCIGQIDEKRGEPRQTAVQDKNGFDRKPGLREKHSQHDFAFRDEAPSMSGEIALAYADVSGDPRIGCILDGVD